MPEHDFIFVDESGDPGYSHDESGNILSSSYYAAAALHICDDSFQYINRFMADFRYYTHMSKELKVPSGLEDYEKLLAPVKGAARRDGCFCAATAVYFDKKQYTGSYLKPRSDRPADPVRFRNYILRYLLEFHFSQTSLQAQQFDLVLDRVEMTKEQKDNLQDYISGNYHIPTPTYVTHDSSIYVEPLQIVHHIATGVKDVAVGGTLPEVLSFVSHKDISKATY